MFNFKKITLIIVLTAVIYYFQFEYFKAAEPPPGSSSFSGGSSRLSQLLGADDNEGYALALEPRPFSFPADHGPHPEFRNEWWYVTGNLDAAGGERFGYELTLFRFSLTPVALDNADVSAWRSNQVYIGHFALTDVAAGDFQVAERYSRGSLGLAGATASPFRVWLDDWSIGSVLADDDSTWRLQAGEDGTRLNLTLEVAKAPVSNGHDGLSQKADAAGNASYYYSITRLDTRGTLTIGNRAYELSGLSWLDREWGSSALSAEQEGWDWFALQLDDGTDLMFYNLRQNDGSQDPHSAGTLTLADGTAVELSHDDVVIEVLDRVGKSARRPVPKCVANPAP